MEEYFDADEKKSPGSNEKRWDGDEPGEMHQILQLRKIKKMFYLLRFPEAKHCRAEQAEHCLQHGEHGEIKAARSLFISRYKRCCVSAPLSIRQDRCLLFPPVAVLK